MKVPSVFIRKEAKGNMGQKKKVEGGDVAGKRRGCLLKILVTTGMSSLAAVQALRDEGAVVSDCPGDHQLWVFRRRWRCLRRRV